MEQERKDEATYVSPNTTQKEEEKTASAITKLLAVIGLVAILAISAWISIQVIRLAPTGFSKAGDALSSAGVYLSSVFGGSNTDEENQEVQALDMTLATTTLSSDEAFTLRWAEDTNEGRSYEFSYSCVEGLTVKAENDEDITCGEPYAFETASSSLSFTPLYNKEGSLEAEFNVRTFATVDGEKTEIGSDSAILTVIGKAEEKTTTKPSTSKPSGSTSGTYYTQPTTVFVPNPRAKENPNGSPDLAVEIVATGVVVEVNNKDVFSPLSPIPTDERGAVQFVVENRGDKTSGTWDFTANLPIEGDDNYEYDSPRQKALRPGDKITFTLSFDDVLEEDDGEIRIKLDTDSNDKTSSNDTARKTVRIDD